MHFPETQASRSARLEGWGGPMVRDAAHEAAELCRSKIAAPHHEGRDELRVRQIDRNPRWWVDSNIRKRARGEGMRMLKSNQ
jgi:hypothetical protein